MLKNIFTKTLYEKRWMALFWTIGVIAMTILTVVFYPSFKQGGFDEVLKNAPKSLQGLIGNTASLRTVSGYVAQQVFALRVPMLVLIMGITLFGGLLAGDENEGTLQSLLAQPVLRLKVFAHKFLAGMVIGFVVCAGVIVGVLGALLPLHEHINFGLLIEATIGVWLLVLLFGAIAFAIGAITGKRSVAGGIAGLLAFGSYLITSLTPNVSALEPFEKLSPFHYYNNPATAVYGLTTHNVLVMAGVVAVFLIVSAIIFTRRDIYQR